MNYPALLPRRNVGDRFGHPSDIADRAHSVVPDCGSGIKALNWETEWLDDRDGPEIWSMAIIAWRVPSNADDTPVPVCAEEIFSTEHYALLMPDGRISLPFEREFPDMAAFRQYLVEEKTRAEAMAAAKQAKSAAAEVRRTTHLPHHRAGRKPA